MCVCVCVCVFHDKCVLTTSCSVFAWASCGQASQAMKANPQSTCIIYAVRIHMHYICRQDPHAYVGHPDVREPTGLFDLYCSALVLPLSFVLLVYYVGLSITRIRSTSSV